MAVISCKEVWEEQAGSIETGGKGNEGIQHRFTREFRIETNDPLDDGKVVLAWHELPNIHAQYRSGNDRDDAVLCIDRTPHQQADARTHWKVICEYASKTSDPKRETVHGGPGKAPKEPKDSKQKGDPAARPPKYQFSYQRWCRYIQEDLDGFECKNSVDEPFDPPLEVEDILPVMRVTKVETDYFPTHPRNMMLVSDAPWMGHPAGAARQIGVDADEFVENGVRYHTVTRTIIFRDDPPWNPLILLQYGYRELGADGKPQVIMMMDADGTWHQPSQPVPIKSGRQAKRPGPMKFRVFTTWDFGDLSIPDPNAA